MSVEDAINYKPSEEEDYYALLSCDESSTVSDVALNFFVCLFVEKSVRFLLMVSGICWLDCEERELR